MGRPANRRPLDIAEQQTGGSINMRMLTVAGALLAIGLVPGQAWAQEGAAFFDGKTITYIVATDPGGG